MDNTYEQFISAFRRIGKGKEQKESIVYQIIALVLLGPFIYFVVYGPIASTLDSIGKYGFSVWINQVSPLWLFLGGITISIGLFILYLPLSGIFTDIRIIILLKKLEIFNMFWENNRLNMYNLDEIVSHIQSIHGIFRKLPIIKQSAYADKRYLSLQKIETEYFMEILLNLRSDLATRLNEQQQSLESAKSEVEKNIGGTSDLESVSEVQKAMLDRQIEQFEELQRVLVKV